MGTYEVVCARLKGPVDQQVQLLCCLLVHCVAGAMMDVALVNDGPVTFIIDSDENVN